MVIKKGMYLVVYCVEWMELIFYRSTGFYEVFQTFPGKLRAIISGHDHKNDLCSVSAPLEDDSVEALCYARASGYPSLLFVIFFWLA